MVKINKPNNYKNVIEAIKEVCGIERGFQANWKGIIDALDMCKGKEIHKILAGKGIEIRPTHGDLTVSDLTVSTDMSALGFCDDCFVYCEPRGNEIEIRQSPAEGPITVIKFSSDSCGSCGRMAHFDQKVAQESGHQFIVAKTSDDDVWNKYQYLLEQAYPNPEQVGFPTYVIAQGQELDDLQVLGHFRGATDKGTYRQRLKDAVSGGTNERASQYGGDIDSHCTDFEATGGCKPFRFDCWGSKARVCQGDGFKLSVKLKTHGCNDCEDADPPGGNDLSYSWYYSKESKQGPWKFVKDGPDLTIKPGKEYKAGDVIWFQGRAKCKDYPGGSVEIRGGGGPPAEEGGDGLQPIKVTIVECNGDPENPPKPGDFCATKKCPDGQFCCEDSQTCAECCNNKQCPAGQICKNGKCVDKPECSADKDCPGDQICENGICVDPPPPPIDPPPPSSDECNADKDCPGDQICENGVCVDPLPECTKDGDCPGDQICENGKCVDPPPLVVPDLCDGVTCPPGEKCENGKCYPQICLDNNCNGGWIVDWDCVKTKLGI